MPPRRLATWLQRAAPGEPWDGATAVLLALLAGLAAMTFRDYGPTIDEPFHREIGQRLLAWWGSGFSDRQALDPGPYGNFHYYGGLFDGLAELAAGALPLRPYEARHLVNAAWSLGGLAGAGLLGRRLGGPRGGFLAVALLAATGAWWGHGFANPKDIPFGAAFPWLLVALLGTADRLPALAPGPIAGAGLALGAALGTRPAGLVVLLPLTGAVLAVRVAADPAPRRSAPRAVLAAVAALALGWVVMLAAWPWAQLGPLWRPFEAAAALTATTPEMGVHYAGAWWSSHHLPWSYLPGWLARTVPDAWLLALALAAAGIAAGPRRLAALGGIDGAAVAALGVLAPIVAVAVLRPPAYDGHRHFLFVLPLGAAWTGASASLVLAAWPRWAAAAGGAALVLGGGVGVADLVALHPYQYLAYNRAVAGGVARGAAANEGDYWGASVREGARWLAAAPGLAGTRPVLVATNASPVQLVDGLAAVDSVGRFRPAPLHEADILLATTRLAQHRTPGEVLHVVERLGAPLLYVIALRPVGAAGVRRLPLLEGSLDISLPGDWLVRPDVEIGDPAERFELVSRAGSSVRLAIRRPSGPAAGEAALQSEAAQLAGSGASLERVEGGTVGWVARWLDGAAVTFRSAGALQRGRLRITFEGRGAPAELEAAGRALVGAVEGPPTSRRP